MVLLSLLAREGSFLITSLRELRVDFICVIHNHAIKHKVIVSWGDTIKAYTLTKKNIQTIISLVLNLRVVKGCNECSKR